MSQHTENTAPVSNFIIRTFPVGPLQCNCSVIGDRLSGKALVVDPGGDAGKILALLKELNLRVVAIIHTHAHLDHILASGEIKKAPAHRFICTKATNFSGTWLKSNVSALVYRK